MGRRGIIFFPISDIAPHPDPYRQFTHSAQYQSKDLGENFGKDISIMSKEVLRNVKVTKILLAATF